MENYGVESSTRGGGFGLCSRGLQPPGFLVDGFLGFWIDGFLGGWAIGFFVDGRSGFLWMGDRVFCGWAIEFDLLVR